MTKAVEAPAFDLEALKGFLADTVKSEVGQLRAEIDELRGQVVAAQEAAPRFQPMQNSAEWQDNLKDMQLHEQREGVRQQIPMTANGRRMDQGAMAAVMAQYQPRFTQGQRVRVNPTAHRDGWPEGKTWDDILKGTPAVGYIAKRLPFSWRGWQYSARIRGVTKLQGMRFEEHELIPA